jgi:hypothetical protein
MPIPLEKHIKRKKISILFQSACLNSSKKERKTAKKLGFCGLLLGQVTRIHRHQNLEL